MIIPQSQLLWWTAAGTIPAALIYAFLPGAGLIVLLLVILWLCVPAIDWLFSCHKQDDLLIQCPPLIHMMRANKGSINLRIHWSSLTDKEIRVGMSIPGILGCDTEDMIVSLGKNDEGTEVSFPCIPLQRGNCRIGMCYLGVTSRLGFWLRRIRKPLDTEIRIYPNLLSERKVLAKWSVDRNSLGMHVQRQIGQGHEFEKLREYVTGDSYDDIHWKATARRGRPITKVFQIERTQEVYVVIDSSRLSARQETVSNLVPGKPAIVETTLDRYLNAALILGTVAQKQGDLFGVVSFSDRVNQFVRAKGGHSHYRVCRDALYSLQPQAVSPDYDELFTFLRMRLGRRAMLFFLTNLDDPVLSENFMQSLPILTRQHLVMVNMILPRNVAPLFSKDIVQTEKDIYQNLCGHLKWSQLREFQKSLSHQGVDLNLVSDETLCPQLVTQYGNIKRRQML